MKEENLTDKLKRMLFHVQNLESIRFVKVAGNISFQCIDQCGKCCQNPVWIPEENALSTGLKYTLLDEKRKIALLNTQDTFCIGLDRESLRCTSYDTRPLPCKSYPFSFDPVTEELFVDSFCPGIGKGRNINLQHDVLIHNARKKLEQWKIHLTMEERQLIHENLFSLKKQI